LRERERERERDWAIGDGGDSIGPGDGRPP